MYGCILPDLLKELGIDRTKTHFTEKIEKGGSIKCLPQMEVAKNELKYKLDKEVYLGYIAFQNPKWYEPFAPPPARTIALFIKTSPLILSFYIFILL